MLLYVQHFSLLPVSQLSCTNFQYTLEILHTDNDTGHNPSSLPLSLRDPTMHTHEHKNRRLLRRLRLLRPILETQHRSQSYKNGHSPICSRCCQNCKRQWLLSFLHGRRMARHAWTKDKSKEHQRYGYWSTRTWNGSLCYPRHD